LTNLVKERLAGPSSLFYRFSHRLEETKKRRSWSIAVKASIELFMIGPAIARISASAIDHFDRDTQRLLL